MKSKLFIVQHKLIPYYYLPLYSFWFEPHTLFGAACWWILEADSHLERGSASRDNFYGSSSTCCWYLKFSTTYLLATIPNTILREISIPHQSISLSQYEMLEFMNAYIVNNPARHKVYIFELFWHLSISLSQHGRFECVNAWLNEFTYFQWQLLLDMKYSNLNYFERKWTMP